MFADHAQESGRDAATGYSILIAAVLAYRPDSHGTCYSACECNQDDCKYSDQCTQFLCDTGYRQRNNENDCVEDLCKGVSPACCISHLYQDAIGFLTAVADGRRACETFKGAGHVHILQHGCSLHSACWLVGSGLVTSHNSLHVLSVGSSCPVIQNLIQAGKRIHMTCARSSDRG